MKQSFLPLTRAILTGILLVGAAVCVAAKEKEDSLILDRIYEYRKTHISAFQLLEDNVYTKYRYNVEKRNFALWLIPTTYVLAKDPANTSARPTAR